MYDICIIVLKGTVYLKHVNISNFGMGIKDRYALFINRDAHGSLSIKKSDIHEIKNESENFTIAK